MLHDPAIKMPARMSEHRQHDGEALGQSIFEVSRADRADNRSRGLVYAPLGDHPFIKYGRTS